MIGSRSPVPEYLRFLGWAVAATALLLALGYLPTRRLGGEAALPAMLAGCLVGLVASALGGIPVAMSRRSPPSERFKSMMGSLVLRMGAALALGAAAALSGELPAVPLMLWVALSYLGLLAVDTWYAVKGF